jgi:hypothetical protein
MVVILTVKKTERKIDGKTVFAADGSKMGSTGLVVLLPEDSTRVKVGNAVKKAAKKLWPNAIAFCITVDDSVK